MKSVKKVIALALVMVVCLSVPAYALSGTATKKMKSAFSKTSFSNTLSWCGGGFNGCKINGVAATYWAGKSPYYADSIKHTNVIKTSKVGSISIGAGGGDVSVEGGTITDEYYIEDGWKLEVDYNYRVYGVLLKVNFITEARVQFGTSFYTWSTAD